MRKVLISLLIIGLNTANVFSQAGISVSPGRMYFYESPGSNSSKIIEVTNPTNRELEIGVSFGDWKYDRDGSNFLAEPGTLNNSCTDWIQVMPGTYFILESKETKRVEVNFQVPDDADLSIPTRTAMLFFTQLNPGETTDASGAAIQVTVRMGVKIYHSFRKDLVSNIEITGLSNYLGPNEGKIVELELSNTGEIWAGGMVKWEIFSEETGETIKLREKSFYTLPNDVRLVKQNLPKDLQEGNYTLSAIITYGENDVLKIAELDFRI